MREIVHSPPMEEEEEDASNEIDPKTNPHKPVPTVFLQPFDDRDSKGGGGSLPSPFFL